MKQALRVAFGFNAVGGGAARRSTYRDHPGVDSARPIGVVPFQWAGPGAAPEDIGGVVAADLRNSGKFNPLDRSRLPPATGDGTKRFNLRRGLRWVLMRWLSVR